MFGNIAKVEKITAPPEFFTIQLPPRGYNSLDLACYVHIKPA